MTVGDIAGTGVSHCVHRGSKVRSVPTSISLEAVGVSSTRACSILNKRARAHLIVCVEVLRINGLRVGYCRAGDDFNPPLH